MERRIFNKLHTTIKQENNPHKVVILFGADGVGKTTQVKLLTAEYRRRGFKNVVCWLRGRHSLAYLLSKLLLYLGWPHIVYERDLTFMDSRKLSSKRLWSLIEFISLIPIILTRFFYPRFKGYVVIAERYVPDTVVFNSFFIGKEFQPYSEILLRMIPPDSMLIHLDSYKEELIARREQDWPKAFIEYQLKQYRLLARQLGAVSINTSVKSMMETHRKILAKCDLI